MTARIVRLTAAELVKTVSHRFFLFGTLALVLLIPLWAHLRLKLDGKEETLWRSYHAIHLFAYGVDTGWFVATFLILTFTAMLFAGEFDRGTIRLILTRPVHRTEVYVAKCVTGVFLTAHFLGVVLFASLAYGLARGELGPVWDESSFVTQSSAGAIVAHARLAVLYSLLPALAAAGLGIFVSTLTESSGFAVAGAVLLFLLTHFVARFLPQDWAVYVFPFYPSEAFRILAAFADGSSTLWRREIWGDARPFLVPGATAVALTVLAWIRFRWRDITV